jgi:outer membrane lipoprotein-sorting protein
MRILQAVSGLVLGVVVCLPLTGCFSTSHMVLKTQAPDSYKTFSVEELEKSVSGRDAAIQTLKAQVLITASTGGSKEGEVKEYTSFKGYIFVQKPENLRVLMQLPFIGSRALDMVSDGKDFTLMMASKTGDKWVQGKNTVSQPSKNGLENLRPNVFLDSLLVPGVKPEEYVVLTESSRVLQEETRHHDAVEEPVYELSVSKLKSGHLLQRERVIHISRVSGLPYQQDIYNDEGQVVTQATYENYQPNGAQQFPMRITIKRPVDEYSLKIDVVKVSLNDTFEADQFELKIPAGVTVRKME